MRKIDAFSGRAKKIAGEGGLNYEVWGDCCGELFVTILDNDIQTEHPGTFSKVFYPVRTYANMRDAPESLGNPSGIDKTGATVTPRGTNNGAFLKAVLLDLLPDKT